MITQSRAVLDYTFPHLDMPLADIGIPPLQILTVETTDRLYAVELTGDKGYLQFPSL